MRQRYTLKMVITPTCVYLEDGRGVVSKGASSTLSEDAVVMTEADFYVKDKGNTFMKVSRAPGDL